RRGRSLLCGARRALRRRGRLLLVVVLRAPPHGVVVAQRGPGPLRAAHDRRRDTVGLALVIVVRRADLEPRLHRRVGEPADDAEVAERLLQRCERMWLAGAAAVDVAA